MQAKLWRCGRKTRGGQGQGVRTYSWHPAGCEVADADCRKAFGDGYQEAGGTHREVLQRVYDKVKTKGVLPDCGRTPYFPSVNYAIFIKFSTIS